jgi:hypothetical protein
MEHRYTTTLSILFMFAFAVYLGLNPGNVYGSTYQNSQEEKLSVYPNPASDQLKIDFLSDGNILPDIEVIDLTGKVVLKYEGRVNIEQDIFKAELDISSLQRGVYFVKLKQGERIYSKKLMVK